MRRRGGIEIDFVEGIKHYDPNNGITRFIKEMKSHLEKIRHTT